MRRDGAALARPSSLRLSPSLPELQRRRVVRERGMVATATPMELPLSAAESSSVEAVAMHAAHPAHTARSAVAARRQAWEAPISRSPEGLRSRVPHPLSAFASSPRLPPPERALGPVTASPSVPCLSGRCELPPLWRPERRHQWQGTRYGEALPSEQTPGVAPTAFSMACPSLRPLFPSVSYLQSHPYSVTR